MTIFIDASALLAILNADDTRHLAAKQLWSDLLATDEMLLCTNYVLVETFALAQARMGLEAVQVLQAEVLPALNIEWVNADLHAEALQLLLRAARRQVSFVDYTSFVTMRRQTTDRAFTFDKHFSEQGFVCVP
jgi:predicted nucleic acid-binding protein